MTSVGGYSWSHLPDAPAVIASSKLSGWSGIVFQKIESSPEGNYDVQITQIKLMKTCGPIKFRKGGSKNAFLDQPTDPILQLPDHHAVGAWRGVQHAYLLMVEPDAFERATGRPYRESAMRDLRGLEPTIAKLLHALQLDVLSGHPGGPALGEAIVAALLHHLLIEAATEPPPPAGDCATMAIVRRLQDRIESSLGGPISLEDLAGEVRVSIRHLCRIFQAGTGQSPYRYILTRRVERAKDMIRKGDRSLQDIAATVGFAHQAHMADTFRKIAKAPPLYFRTASFHSDKEL